MSTRDQINVINDAFKSYKNGMNGHYLALLAEHEDGYTSIYPTIIPQAGPLLIINEKSTNWTTGYTITVEYIKSNTGIWVTGTIFDQQYYYKTFSPTDNSGTYTYTIPTGSREFKQEFVSGYYDRVKTLTVSPSDMTMKVYCLADNGSQIMYMQQTENERETFERILNGKFISPEICHNCTGDKKINGVYCPDCFGYGYYGYSSMDYLLDKQAKSVGIEQRAESRKSFQLRAWAKRWALVPTRSELKRYLSNFLRLETGQITIDESYFPEAKWTVRVPLNINLAGVGIGNQLSTSGTTFQELIDDITPAGTIGIVAPYNYLLDDDSIKDYETDHRTGIIYSIDGKCNFYNASYYSDRGMMAFAYDQNHSVYKYYSGNSGFITPFPETQSGTTGIYSGSIRIKAPFEGVMYVTGFFSGLTEETFKNMVLRQIPYSGVYD
jgi:hypothetical protein